MDKDVIPNTDAGLNTLLQLMKLNLPTHTAALGVSAGEVSQTERDADTVGYLIPYTSAVNAFKEEAFSFKDLIIDGELNAPTPALPVLNVPDASAITFTVGIVKRLRLLIRKIKASPNYNESIGRDLGIVRDSEGISPEMLKPTLKVTTMIDDKVRVEFNKQGQTAVRIQLKRGGGNFETVGDPTTSPFVDHTASTGGNPEKREYRAVYLEKNEPVGQYSDIASVVTTP